MKGILYYQRIAIMRIDNVLFLIALTYCLASCQTQTTPTNRPPTQVATNLIQRQNITKLTAESYPAKNPKSITVYNDKKTPHTGYRVIGVASVSKYNLLGIKRQEKTLNDMMKKLAASIGGDGLINISQNKEGMKANVIAYQRILF
jgi:hypothetical protein